MPAGVQLQVMIAAARERAGQETLDESQALVTDAEATSHLNYALQRVYRATVKSGQNYYRNQASFTTVNGTSSYALAAPFLKVQSVDWLLSPTEVVPVLPYEEAERNRFRIIAGWLRHQPIAFQLQGNSIHFIPTPQGSYDVEVNYTPVYVPLDIAAPTGTFDGIAGFEDYGIWKLASLMAKKDDNLELANAFDAEAQVVWNDVTAMVEDRSGAAPRVQRVRRSRKFAGWDV